MIAMGKQPGGYDNKYPRGQQAELSGWGKRALGAHLNGFEIFPAFAAAVVIGTMAQVDPNWLMILSLFFLVSRIIYLILYLMNLSTLRTTIWILGAISIGVVFGLAIF